MEDKLLKYNAERDFSHFFENKCYTVSLAEKSLSNYNYICRNSINLQWRLYHFAVGHRFKSLPVSSNIIFQKNYDAATKTHHCGDFKSLQIEEFGFQDCLKQMIDDLRNLNNHYIHTFDKLLIDKNSPIACFLKEAFRMATMMMFLELPEKESNQIKWDVWRNKIHNKYSQKDYTAEQFDKEMSDIFCRYTNSDEFKSAYKSFLQQKFYPFDEGKKSDEEKQKAETYINLRKAFVKQSVDDCIDTLLFTEVKEAFDWDLYGDHSVISIKSGTYLSFVGSLFFLSMFLYKDEANQLISKIKGYKRNDDDQMRSKRNIMSFFAKKRSSQDYDCEERSLIYARDIIQYLNKYPTTWNKEIDLDNESKPTIAKALKERIEEMEMDRLFPEMTDDLDFKQYAVARIFRNESPNPPKPIYRDFIEKNSEVKAVYQEITNNKFQKKSYKPKSFKMFVLRYVVKTYFSDKPLYRECLNESFGKKHQEFETELNTNKAVDRLKNRLKHKSFYTSYGRNQDRFMEIAVRYLAQTKYFGDDAQFKMYRFYTTDEQDRYLREQEQALSKKEYDALRFHGGKLTYYATYPAHLEKYPEWDTPFVIENNAVQVILSLDDGQQTIVSIQRPLLVYLLQDALFAPASVELKGNLLLRKYFHKAYKTDFEAMHLAFKNKNSSQQATMKKLLPRRAVKKQLTGVPVQQSLEAFRRILAQAQEHEKRYQKLLEYKKATSFEAYDNFVRNNKGKQFKLQFVRKAWHIMYFKDIYKASAPTQDKHHKSLHITRDEFNDFCRYMFAMDTVSDYKLCLRNLLDSKCFFKNEEFKNLFDNGHSLDDYYRKTKEEFNEWIKNQEQHSVDTDKYQLAGYKNLFGNHILYINLSHFLAFMKNEKRLLPRPLDKKEADSNEEEKAAKEGIDMPALCNKKHLIADYYLGNANRKEMDKAALKASNALMTQRLEDCLLYEIAIHYFTNNRQDAQSIKKSVSTILVSDYTFPVMDKTGNYLYSIEVPFKQIERYVGIVNYYKEKAKDFSSFITDLPQYLSKAANCNDIKTVISHYNAKKSITLEEFHQVQKHIVTESGKFLAIYMELEKYFVWKDKLRIKSANNRITYREIASLHNFLTDKERNIACHFGIPDGLYSDKTKAVEKEFVKRYIPNDCTQYGDIPKQERVVTNKLLRTAHNNYFDHKERDKVRKVKNAEDRYFKEIIRGYKR